MRRIGTAALIFLSACSRVFALNPALDISQYGHDAWTVRSGFIKGNIYAIAQTTDGYLWLGGEFGLFRFDGVRNLPWQPPADQHLAGRAINRLLAARDGTLWIGTFEGLASWHEGKLTRYPEFEGQSLESLLEDHEGTVWAGSWGPAPAARRLCAMRKGGHQCYGEDGRFGKVVSALYEDGAGNLWASAESGLWRIKPGLPRRYATPPLMPSNLSAADDGRLLIARYGAGLMQLAGDNVETHPVRAAANANRLLPDREVNANKLLRDRDGGLWIGTVERGLIHVHRGRTDVFTRSEGLLGDVVLSIFEDREGSVWVSSTGGLDRFRELPVTTISVKQGLCSDATQSVLAATDGSVWVGTHDGLNRWQNGQFTIFRKANGLPDDATQSLFQDDRGRIWVSTPHGLAYFQRGRFIASNAVPAGDVHFITGDKAGNLWLSWENGLIHLAQARFVERIPWGPQLGNRDCCAEVLLSGRDPGGVWLGFWTGGGVSYFKDGRVRATYRQADGLGAGHVPDLRLDRDGALWAATEEGGLSRIKDGRIATLTSRNGLPCDTIHWTIEDHDGSVWLYTGCALVFVARSELEAWIADPQRRIETTVWDATDGIRLRPLAATAYGPRVTQSTDGRLWFLTGEGVHVLDPHHAAMNAIPPPVHIEQISADGNVRWRNWTGPASSEVHLPARIHDLQIDYTALSLAAPEKVRFKYKLEGQDEGWREVINGREAKYTNLRPRHYRFRVMACNNSGVWNQAGDSLEFSIAPALYQANWFRGMCAAVFLAMLWAAIQFRVRRLQHEFDMRLEERVEERTRIARELHDTLLQSFQGLMFSFQAARNLLPGRTEEAMRTLEAAIREGDAAIAEGRDAIQGLRANPAVESNLELLLTAAGKELATACGEEKRPAFQVSIEGIRQPLAPLLQDELYRIAREILLNAFHHAGASHVEVEVAYDGQFFRLRIRDDGKGIERKVLEAGTRPGHWGLPGARERAKRIGGQLKLWSEPGAGTEAELTVPARIAYETVHGRGAWRRFRKSHA